ncbi:hypothetical protein ACJMK2_010993 [Sinanodonta woodiana]|uniref:Kazal-like domain-containing protein n=1 Tax=Sinanodonta woodiana TaxID=1069815 RepID=A0ABD3V5C8_SINWO
MMKTLLLLLSLVIGALGQNIFSCSYIATLNCEDFKPNPQCGTDGKTYHNMCVFGKDQCSGLDVHIQHTGECHPSSTQPPSGVTTGPISVAGSEAVLDFFCLELFHIDCPATVDRICGSNGRTYLNFCEYEKARCTHRDLHVLHYGPCAV